MKFAAFFSEFKNNSVFDRSNAVVNRDGCSEQFIYLKAAFEKRNVVLVTEDCSPDRVEFCIYLNNWWPACKKCSGREYLLAMESELIAPQNWRQNLLDRFDKIFTWNDVATEESGFVKVNFSHRFPSINEVSLRQKEKLCVLIAGNKRVNHPLELYSDRVETIRWFEEHHSGDFDLYGIGWDEYRFSGPKLLRALNRVKPLVKLLAPTYPSYKGPVISKREVLQHYWFSICYENARDIPGYITEKIFDCFFAGCVPVYWGANNVTDHIPAECFIDRREFSSHESLYDYMKGMSRERYQAYLDSIRDFLQSERAYPFTAEYFADTIVNEILGDE